MLFEQGKVSQPAFVLHRSRLAANRMTRSCGDDRLRSDTTHERRPGMASQNLRAIVLDEDDVPDDHRRQPASLVYLLEPCRFDQLLALRTARLDMNRSDHIEPGKIRD